MGSYSAIFLLAALMETVEVSIKVKEAQLAYDYYKYSCPCLEAIVKKEILSISFFDASAPAAFLRLLFHDCQVQVILWLGYTYLNCSYPGVGSRVFCYDFKCNV